MAVRTGVMSSSTPGKALYDLIAVDLAANANWSRPPVDPSLSGGTDSWGANYTSQVWRCDVGSSHFFVVFSYDNTSNPLNLFIQAAELYAAVDGLSAKNFSKPCGTGGATAATTDATSVTPASTDVVTASGITPNTSSPNWGATNLLGVSSAMPYLYKVGNKSVTLSLSVTGVGNRWVHVGAMESLITGPSDPMPLGLFTHCINNPANKGGSIAAGAHVDGVVSRNPGLGVTAETGAFFATLQPLHGAGSASAANSFATLNSACSYGAPIPRWYTKVLMSQAVVHQARAAHGATQSQSFRGYYPDLFAGVIYNTTEPTGGGADSVVIDGVTYYWMGMNCPGASMTSITSGQASLIAVRAD